MNKNFKFYGPFYGWGSILPRLQSHYKETSLIFTTKSSGYPGSHLIDVGIERLSQPWKHKRLVILNPGLLDWETRILTTGPLLHRDNEQIAPNKKILEKSQNWARETEREKEKMAE